MELNLAFLSSNFRLNLWALVYTYPTCCGWV